MAENPSKVQFVFTYDPQYRVCAANGIWGGVTPKGDLRLDFFVESFEPPETQTQAVTLDGQLGPELERVPMPRSADTAVVNRRLMMAVVVSASQVQSWADFLTQKANEIKGVGATKDNDDLVSTKPTLVS